MTTKLFILFPIENLNFGDKGSNHKISRISNLFLRRTEGYM